MREDRVVRMVKLFLMIAMLLSVLSSTALAIGVSPSKRIFDYRPGQKVSYDIDIVNNGHEDLEVILYARGEFSDGVEFDRQMLSLSADDDSRQAKVTFRMPGKLEIAGQHEIDIVAVGSTPPPEGQDSVVKADIAVISKLVMDVPYPDKYAEARLYVLDTEIDSPVAVTVPVFNKGKVDIDEAFVSVKLFSPDGRLVDELASDTVQLKTGRDHKFTVISSGDYGPGTYRALVVVNYDGAEIELETMFNIGELKVDVRSLVVNSFSLGDVANFDILLYNAWSTELKNVFAEMEITDQDNNMLTSFRTVATDIPAQELGRLEGYWYTEGVAPGIYTATIDLHYANRMSRRMFELEVHPDRIITRPIGSTGQAITAGEELDLQNNAFLILSILVLSVVIGVLLYRLRKRKGEMPPADKPGVKPEIPDRGDERTERMKREGAEAKKKEGMSSSAKIEQIQSQLEVLKSGKDKGPEGEKGFDGGFDDGVMEGYDDKKG